jgi:hypothetical protein
MLFMYTAIEKAGIQNWYNDSVSNTTFLVLNDDALKAYMTSKAKLHITDFTDIELRNYFKQTICKGKHLTINLGNNDLKVETIQPNYFVYFRVAEITGTAQLPSAWYTLLINGSAGIKTSNLETTNGVVHVFSKDFNRGTYVPH